MLHRSQLTVGELECRSACVAGHPYTTGGQQIPRLRTACIAARYGACEASTHSRPEAQWARAEVPKEHSAVKGCFLLLTLADDRCMSVDAARAIYSLWRCGGSRACSQLVMYKYNVL